MMPNKQILGIAFACLLLCGSTAWAAGKHKPSGHGKSATPGHDTSGATGTTDTSSAKASGAQAESRPGESRAPVRESVRQESRIEFDERMLKGQSAAGVIYLFQRTPSDWKSIVEVPDSFRARTVNLLAPAEDKK
jgi:hypothetical protein